MACKKGIYDPYGNINTMTVAHISYKRNSIDSQLQFEQSSFHLYTLIRISQAKVYY